MTSEMYHVLVSVVILLFIFWLLYRIKKRLTRIIKNKIVDEFPHISNQIDNFQKTIDYMNSRIEMLERKINAMEKKE